MRLKISPRRGRRLTYFSLTLQVKSSGSTDRFPSSAPLLRRSRAHKGGLMSRCPAFLVREQTAVPPSASGGDGISRWKMSPGTPVWVSQDRASAGAVSFLETGFPDSWRHLVPLGQSDPRGIAGAPECVHVERTELMASREISGVRARSAQKPGNEVV